MEKIRNRILIIVLMFFTIFCSSQQKDDIDRIVKNGLENIGKPSNVFFKELKTKKFLTNSNEEPGIFQIIMTDKKYKHRYLLFFQKNDYWVQDAENVSDCIKKIIEFTGNNKENELKEYIINYLSLIDNKN